MFIIQLSFLKIQFIHLKSIELKAKIFRLWLINLNIKNKTTF